MAELQQTKLTDGHVHHHGDGSLWHELLCHFPYSVFAVSAALLLLSLLQLQEVPTIAQMSKFHHLFHTFHYLHIVFAAIGTVVTFFRFSHNRLLGFIIGTLSPAIFCILSDIVLPYLGGRLLGLPMHLHICFFSEQFNIIIFLLVGFITGLALSSQRDALTENTMISKYAHATHILLSASASLFYMVSHGLCGIDVAMGTLFLVLLVCVVVPCTLSDIVVPIWIAKRG